jgi:uncharacterized protein (DUF305 family)
MTSTPDHHRDPDGGGCAAGRPRTRPKSMISHHQGAIEMAQAEVAHGQNPDTITMAKSIITDQQAEIDRMEQMLGG